MHPLSTMQAPLTYDDLIDLHYLLQVDELFMQLMAVGVKVGEGGRTPPRAVGDGAHHW